MEHNDNVNMNQAGENLNKIVEKTVNNFNQNATDKGEGPGPIDEGIVKEKYENNQLQNRIKEMRKRTDSLFRTVKMWGNSGILPAGEAGRYIALTVTSLESARHFLGKMLAEKGAPAPYSKEAPSATITDQGEPLTDVPGEVLPAIHFLRDKIENEVVETCIYIEQVAHLSPRDFVSQNNVLTRLMEAKCWLGEIIGIIVRAQK